MNAPFVFEQQARNLKTLAIVCAVWLVLFAAWLWLDAALWIIAFLAAFTLPALYDLAANPASGLTLDDNTLSWFSGRRHAAVDLSEIDHIRLDTRLDFSVRVTAVLTSGRKIRLPFEATPPHVAFEETLNAQGIKTQRHHFQLLQ
ncbi:MAG: hypothetical protein WA790_00680 [Sulfitobacter sp.]